MGPYDNYFAQPQSPQMMNGYVQNQVNNVNKIYVMSIEDALSRPMMNNTRVIFYQGETIEYEVTTDAYGRKDVKIFDRILHEENKPKEDDRFSKLEQRISELEKKLEPKTSEEVKA